MVKNQTIYNFELILSEKDFCLYNTNEVCQYVLCLFWFYFNSNDFLI